MLRLLKKAGILMLLSGVFLFGYAGQASAIPVTYNDLNSQTLTTVLFTGDYPFEITNNTGQTWTDFHFQLVDFGDVPGPPVVFSATDPYSGPGTATVSQDNQGLNTILNVDNLDIPSGQVYNPTLSMATVEGARALVGNPTVGGMPEPGPSPVPAPAPLALMGLGLLALPLLRRSA